MDAKYPGCHKMSPVFGHKQKAVLCVGCCIALSAYRRKRKAGRSAGHSTKSTLVQDEWEAIPVNTS
ncbi:rCG42944, isoform CRA_a [Rattus norvegicus]|uniref:RCG42944, isoform CRA_a n=1 Tax=Rattus norvegicus TaxID=10116 RepID=A6JZY7_RAT|nr:rCG42944, isoform CRA_a [Rattus norvegicus]